MIFLFSPGMNAWAENSRTGNNRPQTPRPLFSPGIHAWGKNVKRNLFPPQPVLSHEVVLKWRLKFIATTWFSVRRLFIFS
jgi:hypothetical protein